MQVELTFTEIQNLKVATKVDPDDGLVSVIQFETKIHPGDIARLLNLQRQFCPIFCTIGSKQAAMELIWQIVKEGGELSETNAPAVGVS